jgi:DNA-binding transcriptional LysR family regulator
MRIECHQWCMDAPIDLNQVRAFAAVHQAGSFSTAAKRMGVPRSTLSRAVSALEEGTRVRLFQRTTRTVTTTAAGLALFERIAPSLASIERSLADLPDALEAPTGVLRLTTTVDLGTTLVAPVVAQFEARHPDVRVEVQLGGAVVDLVKERFDLALRFAPGKLASSTLVARRLGEVRFQYFASPGYLARRGTPRSEAELAAHDLIALPGSKRPARTTCDDKMFARELARAGGGIALLPSYLAAEDLTAGRLVRVLPGHSAVSGAVYLVQPSQKQVPRRVALFREVLLERLRQHPLA